MGNDAESPAAAAAGAWRTSCSAGGSTEKRRDHEGKGQRVRRGIGMRLRRRRAEKEEAREAIMGDELFRLRPTGFAGCRSGGRRRWQWEAIRLRGMVPIARLLVLPPKDSNVIFFLLPRTFPTTHVDLLKIKIKIKSSLP